MALIAIQTQPANTTVNEFGTATFTTVLSGSGGDSQSYASASYKWFVLPAWTAVAGATTVTLSLSNVQDSQNGLSYVMTVHSASNPNTVLTSSAAVLTVINSDIVYSNVDWTPVVNGTFSKLGYKAFIPLQISGSDINARYCPHFVSKRDFREFINRENAVSSYGQIVVVGGTTALSSSYNTVMYSTTLNASYSNLGEFGYKVFIPLFISGSQVNERYCPHFVNKRDLREFIDREVEIGGFSQILG